MKVSVIIPVYNSERFLGPCLASVSKQTLRELEIIVVNDGSTDNSETIARQFAARDQRIEVFSQQNQGYGAALNWGLARARGQYLSIVESDDWLEPEMLETLYRLARQYRADIVKSNFYYDRQQFNLLPEVATVGLLDQHQTKQLMVKTKSIWSALYRRRFLQDKNLKFLDLPQHSYQDVSFGFQTLAAASRVCFTPAAFYHYRQHDNQSVKSKRFANAVLTENQATMNYLHQHHLLTTFLDALVANKFYTYKWNIERLNCRDALDFALRAKEDLQVMANCHWLDTDLLDDYCRQDLQFLLRHPRLYTLKTKLAKARHG